MDLARTGAIMPVVRDLSRIIRHTNVLESYRNCAKGQLLIIQQMYINKS